MLEAQPALARSPCHLDTSARAKAWLLAPHCSDPDPDPDPGDIATFVQEAPRWLVSSPFLMKLSGPIHTLLSSQEH